MPVDFGYAGLRLTADEYLALGETQERYELVDGLVVLSPSPTPCHKRIAFLIAHQIEGSAEKATGVQLVPEDDIRITSDRGYRPDFVAYRNGRMPTLPQRFTTPPDLVVEVLSPGSEPMDYITKRDDYDRFGVGEYWVVDPRDVSVRVWRRSGTKMLEAGVESDVISSQSIQGLTVDLRRVRAAIGAAQ
jgi:Uma2 family endonuclease